MNKYCPGCGFCLLNSSPYSGFDDYGDVRAVPHKIDENSDAYCQDCWKRHQ